MLVNMNAKIIRAMSNPERFQGAAVYQIATPINAIMYVLDSLPVLNKTTNIKTDARIVFRKAMYLYCANRKYGSPNRNNPPRIR